jgi:hypothetical protein
MRFFVAALRQNPGDMMTKVQEILATDQKSLYFTPF